MMDNNLRACPVCATVTTAAVCSKHGRNVTIPTFSLAQLRHRAGRYEAGGRNIAAAIKALEMARSAVAEGGNPT